MWDRTPSPGGAAGISATEDSQIPIIFVVTSQTSRETRKDTIFSQKVQDTGTVCSFQNSWCQCLKKKKKFLEGFSDSRGTGDTTLRSHPWLIPQNANT